MYTPNDSGNAIAMQGYKALKCVVQNCYMVFKMDINEYHKNLRECEADGMEMEGPICPKHVSQAFDGELNYNVWCLWVNRSW